MKDPNMLIKKVREWEMYENVIYLFKCFIQFNYNKWVTRNSWLEIVGYDIT